MTILKRTLSPGGVVLCRLESHHDHLADWVKTKFRDGIPRSSDRLINVQNDVAKDAVIALAERFERTLICIDCNLAEGFVKLELGDDIPRHFTFSPSEIANFIEVKAHQTHEIDLAKALAIWIELKPDFEDRLDFTCRMIPRILKGRHRRERTAGERHVGPINDSALLYQLFSEVAPRDSQYLGARIEARSVSNDSAGSVSRPRQKPALLTDADFEAVDAVMQESKPWKTAGPNWTCACCGRSKRAICRKSNTGRWTARIHHLFAFDAETDHESLSRRRLDESGQIIVGSHRHLLICQDCRNISAEAKRRRRGLSAEHLTVDDLSEIVDGASSNMPHKVDFQRVFTLAIANMALVAAIAEYREHCSRVCRVGIDFRLLQRDTGWSDQRVREFLINDVALQYDWNIDESESHLDWVLREAVRIAKLDEHR